MIAYTLVKPEMRKYMQKEQRNQDILAFDINWSNHRSDPRTLVENTTM